MEPAGVLGGDQSLQSIAQRLREALAPVFDRPPSFVSNSQELVSWLRSVGCRAFDFASAEQIPARERRAVVALLTSGAAIPPYAKWYKLFHNSRVLVVPLASFDPAHEVATYTVELLARSDFRAAAARNDEWVTRLLKVEEPLEFSGAGCSLTCELPADLNVMKPKVGAEILPGEWESIGTCFEVGMILDPEDLRPGYTVNGTLDVPGVVASNHLQVRGDVERQKIEAWQLFEEVRAAGGFPLRVEVRDSQVVGVSGGGRDITTRLATLTNERLQLIVTEMAIGTNAGLAPESINWHRNTQLNEGALGIHLGIGDGLTGAHVDFICPGVHSTFEMPSAGVGSGAGTTQAM